VSIGILVCLNVVGSDNVFATVGVDGTLRGAAVLGPYDGREWRTAGCGREREDE
jgi:hypothetical protein